MIGALVALHVCAYFLLARASERCDENMFYSPFALNAPRLMKMWFESLRLSIGGEYIFDEAVIGDVEVPGPGRCFQTDWSQFSDCYVDNVNCTFYIKRWLNRDPRVLAYISTGTRIHFARLNVQLRYEGGKIKIKRLFQLTESNGQLVSTLIWSALNQSDDGQNEGLNARLRSLAETMGTVEVSTAQQAFSHMIRNSTPPACTSTFRPEYHNL